ncbi:sigma-54-dependent Fis family transcriptional regulator [Fulvivirga sp. M361]|uniref:sigma-54-dependent transcriptional regulator n=1 Tax=Fulvivirga sp. M361 TaxID=2594266 RepID=UPI001179909A|nr:sigma-54 dependent transcriptional regulator [Fulvivirga sp. M361]TRX62635.1 sigma-54-dependent Fis family transcriptional regulator [Fulvivirga sp. M361]
MDKVNAHILIVDDDPDLLHTARIVLKPLFSSITTESNPQQLNYLIGHQPFDVVVLDMNYTIGATSGKEGLFWLKHIKQKKPDQQVVMITAYGDIKLAVAAMKAGATDFVVKPWENEKLQATVMSAFKHSSSKKELENLKTEQRSLKKFISSSENELIGNSIAMRETFRVIRKVASTDANVLVLGENGTGKELVAQAIHQRSGRSEEAFIKVDLGAIPESLFESELFGHKKGAFTDARENRQGRFELANNGTLFLDEIGNLSLPMQAKLLTVLQSREVVRVGENVPIPINCRVIAATNGNLHEMVSTKEFREDLLYRLNTVELVLPALRERMDDIPLLTQHFLNNYTQRYRKSTIELTDQALEHLSGYTWPGNVRELQHAVERAVIMAEGDQLDADDFLLNPKAVTPVHSLNLDDMEKAAIERAIQKNQGNISKAAKELGLGRTTIYRKLDKYGIKY